MAIIDSRCNTIEEFTHTPEVLSSVVGRRFPGADPSSNKTSDNLPPQVVDIAIVGGGIIGCGLACEMMHSQSFHKCNIALLDPHPYLIQQLFRAMSIIHQRVMRSPYDHQIAPDHDVQLLDYARLYSDFLSSFERKQIDIALSGQRSVVPADIFIAHTAHVLSIHNIYQFAYRFLVQSLIQNIDNTWTLQGNGGYTVKARAVILATGSQPASLSFPLARAYQTYPDRIQIAYSGVQQYSAGERVMVVGSGLTVGHTLLNILSARAFPVWVLRNEERYQCTDVNSAYFRTEGIARFRKRTLEERMVLLAEEGRGSFMLEMLPLFQEFENTQRLKIFRHSDISQVTHNSKGSLYVHLSSGASIEVDRIILATGAVPRTELLPQGIELLQGKYPLLHEDTLEIQGANNLFVAGILASLALGPAAKNIDGARLAIEKLLPTLEEIFGKRKNTTISLTNRVKGTSAIALVKEREAC